MAKEIQEVDDLEFTPGGSKGGFKEIVMRQMYKVTMNGNVEFRGGYTAIRIAKNGQEIEIYVPDTRETFCNGVLILAYLLKPKFTEDMKIAFKKYVKKIKTITNEFTSASTVDEKVILGDSYYTEERDKILLETYRNKKLRIHLFLYQKISQLLKDLNYLEIGGETF